MAKIYLDAHSIIETIGTLKQRIGERFPGSGLESVCGHLEAIAKQTTERAAWIAEPIWWMRVLVWLLILAIILIGMIVPLTFGFSQEDLSVV